MLIDLLFIALTSSTIAVFWKVILLTHARASIRRMIAPSHYIQGKGAIYYLGQNAMHLGDKAFVIGGRTALSEAGERLKKSLASNGIEVVAWNDSVKECTHGTIDRLVEEGRRERPHFVVGVGGGKAIDTAKSVAWKMKLPSATVGTQCATNADGSAEAVIHTEDHRFLEAVYLPRNPVIVIEDTEVLFKAPLKYMIWGMGDALSAKFEAEAYAKARERRRDGAVPTAAALALADACFRSLMANGVQAVKDAKNGIHSLAVDEIIECVKLTSAIAFENTGCALAHALHNGLMKTGEIRGEHGEIVAYTTIVQAAYERRPRDEVRAMVDWCERVGLPTKLRYFGEPSRAAVRQACQHAAEKDIDSRNMPENVKPSELMNSIEEVERGL
jgi:glycerol dehydrogenase